LSAKVVTYRVSLQGVAGIRGPFEKVVKKYGPTFHFRNVPTPPTSAPVGRSVHRMGCVSSSSS